MEDVARQVLADSVRQLDGTLASLRSVRPGGEAVSSDAVLSDVVPGIVPAQPSADQIHQARVASRRLRVHVRVLAPQIGPDRARLARDLLGSLARSLGAVRDLDVLAERLQAAAGRTSWPLDPHGVDGIAAALVLARTETLANAWAALDRFDAGGAHGLVARLPEVQADDNDARTWAGELVGQQWRSLRRAVAATDLSEAATVDGPAAEQLHRVRLRAKRLRYTVEALDAPLGRRARRVAVATARFTDAVGLARDEVAAGRWLAQLAALHPDCGFVAGRLSELVATGGGGSDLVLERWAAVRAAVERAGW